MCLCTTVNCQLSTTEARTDISLKTNKQKKKTSGVCKNTAPSLEAKVWLWLTDTINFLLLPPTCWFIRLLWNDISSHVVLFCIADNLEERKICLIQSGFPDVKGQLPTLFYAVQRTKERLLVLNEKYTPQWKSHLPWSGYCHKAELQQQHSQNQEVHNLMTDPDLNSERDFKQANYTCSFLCKHSQLCCNNCGNVDWMQKIHFVIAYSPGC